MVQTCSLDGKDAYIIKCGDQNCIVKPLSFAAWKLYLKSNFVKKKKKQNLFNRVKSTLFKFLSS